MVLYPKDRVIVSKTHPKLDWTGGENTLYVRGRDKDACKRKLVELAESSEYTNIFAHYCGMKPAAEVPVPEHTYELLVNVSQEREDSIVNSWNYWWMAIKTKDSIAKLSTL